MLLRRKLLIPAFLVGFVLLASSAVAAPIVTNGSFETGDRSGWRVSNRGSGDWIVTDDPQSINSDLVDPPHGTYAIVSDQSGPGSHVLHQTVQLPRRGRLGLRFVLMYDSDAPLRAANTLRHDTVNNQQFRMDVIRPGAPLRTLNPNNILATAFRTQTGGPQTLSERTISEGLTQLGGRNVRLRFVEVDNQSNFHVVIDNVRIVRL
jgi:hypothetical protein